jgi:membrane protease YdiL (CAAX protease family)
LSASGQADPPPGVRRRAAIELSALAALTTLYLAVWPQRSPGVDPGMALAALVAVGLTAPDTKARFWGVPQSSARERARRAWVATAWLTLPGLLGFGLLGAWDAYSAQQHWGDVARRLCRTRVAVATVLYIPWALVQQILFQFYLLGRLRALWPSVAPLGLAVLNGLLFGAVHLPDWDQALLAASGGTVWSYVYCRYRSLLPIALSHALLGAAYFYWVRDHDLLRAIRWSETPAGP